MNTLNLNTLIVLVLTAWLPLAANSAEATDTSAPVTPVISQALSPAAAQSLESAKATFGEQQRRALSMPAESMALPTVSGNLAASATPRIAQTTRSAVVAMAVQTMP